MKQKKQTLKYVPSTEYSRLIEKLKHIKNISKSYLQYDTPAWSDIFENSWLLMFSCWVPRLPITNWIIFPCVSRYGFWSHKSIARTKKNNTQTHTKFLLLQYTDFYKLFKYYVKMKQYLTLMHWTEKCVSVFFSCEIQWTFNFFIFISTILIDGLQFTWRLFKSKEF